MPDCTICKGRGFCGRACPIYGRLYNIETTLSRVDSDSLSGASPPSIFVGRFNYPNIQAGVLIPPETEKTHYLDAPEKWFKNQEPISSIISLRNRLVNSRFRANIKRRNSFLDSAQELALSGTPVDTEAEFRKPPTYRLQFNLSHLPMGPHADLNKLHLTDNPSVPKKVDYLVYDTNAKSHEVIQELYSAGISTNHIQRLLSIGLLGQQSSRKLVPTRWAITATDSNLSNFLRNKIYSNPEISEFEVYSSQYLGNHFTILLLPRSWSFELIEAYFKGSVWSPEANAPLIHDYESGFGRKSYANTTAGAYYAAKLGVLSNLAKRKRQASALLIREITPDYYAPMGVWIIRETVRDALQSKPRKFSSLDLAFKYMQTKIKTPKKKIFAKSWLLDNFLHQRQVSDF